MVAEIGSVFGNDAFRTLGCIGIEDYERSERSWQHLSRLRSHGSRVLGREKPCEKSQGRYDRQSPMHLANLRAHERAVSGNPPIFRVTRTAESVKQSEKLPANARTAQSAKEKPPADSGRGSGDHVAERQLLARLGHSAAYRRIVHHDAAGAAGCHHCAHAIAAGLNHLAALGVTRGAGQAAAVFGHFALAHAHGQVAAADHHAVHHAVARAHAALQHRAQALHHAAGHRIVARTGDFHSAGALFHFHGAARNHEHVWHHRGGGSTHRRRCHAGHPHARHAHSSPFHHHGICH